MMYVNTEAVRDFFEKSIWHLSVLPAYVLFANYYL